MGPTCSQSISYVCKALNNCHGRGFCKEEKETTSCQCYQGFSGDQCNIVDNVAACPNSCSSHGRCEVQPDQQTFKCSCESTWTGDDCATSKCGGSGNEVCSSHGVCEPSEDKYKCKCDSNWSGDQCQSSDCPNGCSGHGTCKDKTCICVTGWKSEPDCSKKDTISLMEFPGAQPEATENQPSIEDLAQSSCPDNCNDHGVCENGKCSCMRGFINDDCSGHDPDVFADEFLLQFDESDASPKQHVVSSDFNPHRVSMAQLWD